MNGIILIDKPKDWTSHDAVNIVRRWAREVSGDRKIRVGHAGTLDPLATGVLPICVGRATKFVDFIGNERKQYRATMRLGIVSDTQDVTGKLEVRSEKFEVNEEILRSKISEFIGVIQQVPPMYSAIKKDGIKLYDLARKGIEVERRPREITIYDIKILGMDLPDVEILVDCSKGTYIRTLCHDIGAALGCGAVLAELVRTKVGSFDVSECRQIRSEKLGVRSDFEFVNVSVCIGTFDGVHEGHKKLVELAKKEGRKVAALVVEPDDGSGAELTSAEEKADKLRQAGADMVISVPLKSVRDLSPEDFFEEYIVRRLNAKAVAVGFNFSFGRKQRGNVDTLKELCDKKGIELRILEPVVDERGAVISSTALKNLMNNE